MARRTPEQVRELLALYREIQRHLPPFSPEELARILRLDHQPMFDQARLAKLERIVRSLIPTRELRVRAPDKAWSRYVELRVHKNLESLCAVVQLACELGRTPESTAATLRRARKDRLDAHRARGAPAWVERIFAHATVPGGSTMDLLCEVQPWEQETRPTVPVPGASRLVKHAPGRHGSVELSRCLVPTTTTSPPTSSQSGSRSSRTRSSAGARKASDLPS